MKKTYFLAGRKITGARVVPGIIGVGYSKVHSGLHCPMISENACEIEVPIDKFLLSLLLWCWLLFDEGSMAMV